MFDSRQVLISAGAAFVTVHLLAAAAVAQAVCTAPHSSPGLGQGGAITPLLPGAGWVQLSAYAQNAGERFDEGGKRTPFFLDGESSIRSVYLTAAWGLLDGVELWAQAALHRLRYSDQAGTAGRTGLGDVRIATRVAAHRVGLDVPVNLRAGVKLPGSRFPVDARVLPLSEGQIDAEASLESGHSFAEGALYTVGGVGYRWRFGESAKGRAPANEWFARVGIGGGHSILRWEVAAEGLHGGAPVQQGVALETDRRRMLQLAPTLAVASGPGEIDLTVQLPAAGRNLPSDGGWSLGYRISW